MSDPTLSPDDLAKLRGHVVYTADGTLADTSKSDPQTLDDFRTTAADVQAIVATHLDEFVRAQHDKGKTGPVPVLIWAHGGLTTKAQGMATAHRQVSWWLANGVFPIHAVWESGFLTTLQDVLGGRPGQRGFTDVTDLAVEAAARLLGGRKFWDDMKVDAVAASLGPGDGHGPGGGYVLAAALRDYVQKNPRSITLHAAGHSAGSIYHSAFVPLLFDGDDAVPSVKTVTFLAPAVRLDTFEQKLLPLARNGSIEDISIFTLNKDQEKRDNTAGVYRKSLLWLVSRSLEVEKEARILGLEEHLTQAGATMSYLRQEDERLVLGPTNGPGKRTSSQAKSHGDFDNDVATMMSVARRVVGTRAAEADDDIALAFGAESRDVFPPPPPEPTAPRSGAPRKRALCIGIDAYSKKPLSGCVADAQTWEDTFTGLGFQVARLRDKEATRDAILREMLSLVTTSADGDVVAIQFAGHGTSVPDLDGDEVDSFGTNDEALCPIDFTEGQLVLDDDLAVVWDAVPDGVSVSLFFDSCHSGTANRKLSDADKEAMTIPAGTTARKVSLDAEERERFRAARGAALADPVRREALKEVVASESGRAVEDAPRAVREVLFSACQPDQVALETGGNGVFTTNATKILVANPAATNREFHTAVRDAMAQLWEQKPSFEPGAGLADRPLLSSLNDVLGLAKAAATETNGQRGPAEIRTAAIVAILRATADLLESGGSS